MYVWYVRAGVRNRFLRFLWSKADNMRREVTRGRARNAHARNALQCVVGRAEISKVACISNRNPHARRVTVDPLTGRATERYANAAHCRLAGGASVEAHLAAVAANALPEHMTQLDHLLRCGWKTNTLKRVHASAHTRTHAQALPREAGLRAHQFL